MHFCARRNVGKHVTFHNSHNLNICMKCYMFADISARAEMHADMLELLFYISALLKWYMIFNIIIQHISSYDMRPCSLCIFLSPETNSTRI